MNHINDALNVLKGVGKGRLGALKQLQLTSIADLLYYYPFRYEDWQQLRPIVDLPPDQPAIIKGRIVQTEEQLSRQKKSVIRALVTGEQGSIVFIWFNQGFLLRRLAVGKEIVARGKVQKGYEPQLLVDQYHLLASPQDTAWRQILPIYRGSEKITTTHLRNLVGAALAHCNGVIPDEFPPAIRARHRLLPLGEALTTIHRPQDWDGLAEARRSLIIREFVLLLLGLQKATATIARPGHAHVKSEVLCQQFLDNLPFALTNGQKQAILEIKQDMEKPAAMFRLLQGDVGSGKTVVAIYTLLKAIEGGYQSALMAPTEILAEQHYLNLTNYLQGLSLRIVLLTGNTPKKAKEEINQDLASGEIDLIIGTHALIQDGVDFANLGAVVIDEQHRFGVKQRQALEEKGYHPDTLVMTATPIPRSMALTVYGELDLSVIAELPPGRKKIKTMHILPRRRDDMYAFMAQEIRQGRQAYIVCPLVEESEKLDLLDATALYEELQEHVFPTYTVDLLHGKMAGQEKRDKMQAFRNGQTQILVSTTVIEVGVDVPNASIMVIEHAERFGLAQLHQLRGRVGRGSEKSYCILVSDIATDEARKRIAAMVKSDNGFVIAEEDLRLRGPGEALGLRQHGLADLRLADFVRDIALLEEAKDIAVEIRSDDLNKDDYQTLRETLLAREEQKH